MLDWMIRTEDHALEAFQNLTDDEAIEAYWLSQELDPPFLSDLDKIERMIARLKIDIDPVNSTYQIAIDPRLDSVVWELMVSENLQDWDSFALTDPDVFL